MSSEFDEEFNLPPLEPRFRIEANTWEELLEQLRAILPPAPSIDFHAPRDEPVRPPEAVSPPAQLTHGDLRRIADDLTQRLRDSPSPPEPPEDHFVDPTDWRPHRRTDPGEVRRRFHRRRKRQLLADPGRVWLCDAVLSYELADREAAIREMERINDPVHLERLAEYSTHRVTRRSALDALYRLRAVTALETAALFVRPEVFSPKQKPVPIGDDEVLPRRAPPEFHDDTRDHAVDLLAQLADEGLDDALESMKRIVQYDFSSDAPARLRCLRRLGERIDRMEERRDWEGLSLLYRESRSQKVRLEVTIRLSRYLPDLEASAEVDALLAVADCRPDLRDDAEAAARRIEDGLSPKSIRPSSQ